MRIGRARGLRGQRTGRQERLGKTEQRLAIGEAIDKGGAAYKRAAIPGLVCCRGAINIIPVETEPSS